VLRAIPSNSRRAIGQLAPFRVELKDRSGQHIRCVIAASASVAVGFARNIASFRVSRGCRETGDRNGGEDHHLAQGLQRGRLGRARGFRPRTREMDTTGTWL
jgi:hypothetical protein